ncbi:MAG: hypothetical protein ACP5OM_02970 [Methanothrix sp.]
MEKGSCCQGDAQVRRLKRSSLTLPKARLRGGALVVHGEKALNINNRRI